VPWQPAYLAIFAPFLGTVGESFIIDTDHWRHFWMMLGAMWGTFVAAERYEGAARDSCRGSRRPLRRSRALFLGASIIALSASVAASTAL
jgi:hypothetical protein